MVFADLPLIDRLNALYVEGWINRIRVACLEPLVSLQAEKQFVILPDVKVKAAP